MKGNRVATAVAVCVLLAGAVGAVAVMLRYPRTAPVDTPGLEGSPDANAPTGGEPTVYRAALVRRFVRAGAEESFDGMVARDGDRSRQEWTESGRHLAEIVRPDLGVTWLVDLDRDVYAERSVLAAPQAPADGSAAVDPTALELVLAEAGSGATVERRRLREETVDGHPCVVYSCRATSPSGGVTESTIWEATDLGGLALRSESRGPDGAVVATELRDVRLDVDPALLMPPVGSTRVTTVP